MQKNLILIDDHKMILHGLESYIQHHSSWSVVFTASSKAEFLEKLEAYKTEILSDSSSASSENNSVSTSAKDAGQCMLVALIDIKVGGDDGYEICRFIKEKITTARCIMYSMYSTYGNIMYAFDSGAEGFLSKDADESELITALDAVASGKTYIQQDLMKTILLNSNKLALLTPREKQIYDLICDGIDKKSICKQLHISVRTCENYLSLLYGKLEVSDMGELLCKYGGRV